MSMLSRNAAEVGPNTLWAMDRQLALIEELALDPEAFGATAPDLKEANQRLDLAIARNNRTAQKAAMVDVMRAELWAWWQVFDERQLLTYLYQNRARPGYSSTHDRPSLDHALRIAQAMAANAPDKNWFDFDWEARAVAAVLADICLPPIRDYYPGMLWVYVARDRSIPAYYNGLDLIRDALNRRNGPLPSPVAEWHLQVDCGQLRPHPTIPRQRGRPVRPHLAMRDILAQFLLKLLDRLGLPLNGEPTSGCEVVGQALDRSYDSIRRIWKQRLEQQPFDGVVVKHSWAIAFRHGLHRRHR